MDDVECSPRYDFLLLSQQVGPGEVRLAAACQSHRNLDSHGAQLSPIVLELRCYLHIFNEEANPDWRNLCVANSAQIWKSPVCIV